MAFASSVNSSHQHCLTAAHEQKRLFLALLSCSLSEVTVEQSGNLLRLLIEPMNCSGAELVQSLFAETAAAEHLINACC